MAKQVAVYAIVATIMTLLAGGPVFLLNPLGATFIALWLLWGIILGLGRSSGDISVYEKKQHSFIMLSGVVCFTLMMMAPWEHVYFDGPLPRDGLLPWLGIVVFAAGLFLQWWSLKELGSLYTTHLGIQDEHHLITSGPYSLVRHPGYLSSIVIMLGMALSMGSLIMVVAEMLSTVLIVWRIEGEEEMLVAEFGGEYWEYRRKTRKLFPYFY